MDDCSTTGDEDEGWSSSDGDDEEESDDFLGKVRTSPDLRRWLFNSIAHLQYIQWYAIRLAVSL